MDIFLYDTGDLDGENIVPTCFPGTLFLTGVVDKDGKVSEEGPYLSPEYRRYKDHRNDEFEYFMTRIMERISPVQRRFKNKCGVNLLSNIYTVSDEAYGLTMLYTQLELWNLQKEDKNNGRTGKDIRKRKRNSLNTDGFGWNWAEKNVYGALLKEVAERREEENSLALERNLRKVWRNDDQVNRHGRSTTGKKKETTGMKHHELVDEKTQEQFDLDMQDM